MRGQISTEFMAMISIGTLMIIIFAVVFSEIYQDNLAEKKRILSEDYGFSLQNEFIMAAGSYPGYTRQFEIPMTLEGFEFDAYIYDRSLVINYSSNLIEFPIPKSGGMLKKGQNTIMKTNESICVNC